MRLALVVMLLTNLPLMTGLSNLLIMINLLGRLTRSPL